MVTSFCRHLLAALLLEGERSSRDSRNFFWQHGSKHQARCMHEGCQDASVLHVDLVLQAPPGWTP